MVKDCKRRNAQHKSYDDQKMVYPAKSREGVDSRVFLKLACVTHRVVEEPEGETHAEGADILERN